MTTETLPALLERRHGIAPRTTLLAAAGIVAVIVIAALLLRDPLNGKAQLVHRSAPVFNLLYKPPVRRVAARPGELERLQARRGPLRATTTVTRLRLPAYRGYLAGVLPVFADNAARRLARRYPRFHLTGDTRARVHTSPGYELDFTFAEGGRLGFGTDLFVVPDKPGERDGVVLSYRLTKPPGRQPKPRRKAAKTMRSAFRSFEFGPDRF
jgi:hypothetical protein